MFNLEVSGVPRAIQKRERIEQERVGAERGKRGSEGGKQARKDAVTQNSHEPVKTFWWSQPGAVRL